MKIAIVGAGPAGCHLAHLLADTEHEIILFDHRAPYEKGCGGGLSPLVGRRFPDVMALPFSRHCPTRLLLRASALRGSLKGSSRLAGCLLMTAWKSPAQKPENLDPHHYPH